MTGANSGIGFETAKGLAAAGMRVVVAGRDEERAERAAAGIRAARPAGEARAARLDLASLDSIAAFAGRLVDSGEPIDVPVDNAGVMAVPQRLTTVDGFELTVGTNHLGHFALTGPPAARPAERGRAPGHQHDQPPAAHPAGRTGAGPARAGALPRPPGRPGGAPLAGGAFYAPTGRRELRGAPGPVKTPPAALDPETARSLWTRSEQLTAVRYQIPAARAAM
ncbi:SDR family NAD(P)-dependent oxidoreductase [Phytohabitans sp. ZYX-F-186]|uniref:SDR family NAD(P)-dependent oxidoreductase n=1 Tax=Phytohabitans maris TaxID=3071409 RepID=A0ABU0Z9Q5_9ACTN|nr:SDR family NAD(P)-dependent oxidoreductase [Phytohabitans sp. ZYX-F-186]MDQ7903189.1 SDR family NAD(P)-dependent oxidoreductase [Phytohabitans sp. ZYX-F-186]